MTLILKLDLDMVKMYHLTTYQVSMSTHSKVVVQKDRHTLPLPHMREVKMVRKSGKPATILIKVGNSSLSQRVFRFRNFWCLRETYVIYLSFYVNPKFGNTSWDFVRIIGKSSCILKNYTCLERRRLQKIIY